MFCLWNSSIRCHQSRVEALEENVMERDGVIVQLEAEVQSLKEKNQSLEKDMIGGP